MEGRLRILMSAYACEPGKGSEPEVGWQWAVRMAKHHDVTVITRANNRATIDKGLRELENPHPKFIYYDPPAWLLKLKNHILSTSVFYIIWQWGAWRMLKRRLSEFDIVHHLTFNAFQLPGFWALSKKPLILGPLGGGMTVPFRLLPLFGRHAWSEAIRSLTVFLSQFNPLVRRSFAQAGLILVANRETEERIPRSHRSKVRRMLETGITVDTSASVYQRNGRGNKILWIGSLIPRKGAGLAIESFWRAAQGNESLRLTIVGRGEEELRLRRLVKTLGLEGKVSFLGHVSHHQIPGILADHDIFLFSSLRDTSGNVVLEAMAASLPVVTINHQGVAEITTAETALQVNPVSITALKRDLASALKRLAASPDLRAELGRSGYDRVKSNFDWSKKVRAMASYYRELLGS